MDKKTLSEFLKGLARSYSQVFFSENYWFAIPLIVVSFIDFSAGLSGLLAALSANLAAKLLNFDESTTLKGLYGFNALLVGLGLGYYYQLTLAIILVAVIAGFLTFLITIVFQGVLGKYYLPYLSVPFVLTIWMVLSAGWQISEAESNPAGLYIINKIFSIGGLKLVSIHEWWINNVKWNYLNSYFTSLGALFFQLNVLAGILVAIALLFYSRIAFMLSIIGYSVAYFAYSILGMDLNLLGYSYIGFNFILGSIAIGGYYYIPSKQSFFWAVAFTPVIALVTAGIFGIFKQVGLPILSLPFNIVLLMLIYSFRFRVKPSNFKEVLVQEGTPEKNLYSFQSFTKRFPNYGWFEIKLPFYGEWFVSQGHNGEYTHQGEWSSAWDFVIVDKDLSQHKNDGDIATDYFCFGQNVIAPADGVVITVEDGIDDNVIGQVNTAKNWGNTVIIKHTEGLYSKLSHLKSGSIIVKEGDNVHYGNVIGKVGNSGRSPYPHLHFQLQSTPYIGSKTLKYPLFAYIEDGKQIKTFDIPEKDKHISSLTAEEILKSKLNFAPGTKLKWTINGDKTKNIEEWEVHSNPYNKLYFHCKETKSTAYFVNDGVYFYFTHFEGDKNSLLYNFYLAAFHLPLAIIEGNTATDVLPANKTFNGWRLFIHDFVAPFYIYLKTSIEVRSARIGSEFDTKGIEFTSDITGYSFKNLVFIRNFKLSVNNDNTIKLVDTISETEAICEPY
ncbi:MAG: urea transporter [Bacteroidales bacterium]